MNVRVVFIAWLQKYLRYHHILCHVLPRTLRSRGSRQGISWPQLFHPLVDHLFYNHIAGQNTDSLSSMTLNSCGYVDKTKHEHE